MLGINCADHQRERAKAAAILDRPATKEALIRRAIRAISDNDAANYVSMMSTVSEVKRACPKRFAKRKLGELRKKWQKNIDKVRKEIGKCAKLFDWKKAREVSVDGGEEKDLLAQCDERVVRLKDIQVRFELEKEKYNVVLKNPYVRGGLVYGFGSSPQCKKVQ